MKLQRISLQADFLKERSAQSELRFRDIMQADLVLYLRSAYAQLKGNSVNWWPETLVYSERSYNRFELFARSESLEYFQTFCKTLGMSKVEDFDLLLQAFKDNSLRLPVYNYSSLKLHTLTGHDHLGKLP